jgi:hypothetical protein
VNQNGQNWVTTLIPFVVIAVVLALRFRSMSKERPLNLSTLWLIPVVYLLLAGSMLVTLPPPPLGWALAFAGLAVGAVAGWYRGKTIRIERGPGSNELRQKASPLAMVLIAALVVLKIGARSIFGETAVTQPGSSALLLTDAFLGFALGLLSATRLELYLRGKRLLSTP